MATRRKSSRYLVDSVEPAGIKRILREASARLRPHLDEFDGIAVRGLSGLLIAPILALRLGKPLIVVRVPGTDTHADAAVESGLHAGRYIIFDDMTRSGRTVSKIHDTITRELPDLHLVATYFYREDGSWLTEDLPLDVPVWNRFAKMRYSDTGATPRHLLGYRDAA